jgi:hypothetical protein
VNGHTIGLLGCIIGVEASYGQESVLFNHLPVGFLSLFFGWLFSTCCILISLPENPTTLLVPIFVLSEPTMAQSHGTL